MSLFDGYVTGLRGSRRGRLALPDVVAEAERIARDREIELRVREIHARALAHELGRRFPTIWRECGEAARVHVVSHWLLAARRDGREVRG